MSPFALVSLRRTGLITLTFLLLPVAGLYKPIWKYRPAELAPDLAAHLIYGAATALCFRASRASGS